MPDIGIRPVFPSQFQQVLAPLVELLIDTVDGGHSMGPAALTGLRRAACYRFID
jgi:hypothetical protein